jgi:hypothetical protein
MRAALFLLLVLLILAIIAAWYLAGRFARRNGSSTTEVPPAPSRPAIPPDLSPEDQAWYREQMKLAGEDDDDNPPTRR